MRKKKPEGHVNHERWLVSYADFITLLFAFFTTLYAISTVDAQKMGKMVLSMKASFDSTVFPAGSDTLTLGGGQGAAGIAGRDLLDNIGKPKEKVLREHAVASLRDLKANFHPNAALQAEIAALGALQRNIEAVLRAEVAQGKVRTRIEKRGLVISLGEGGFFDSGSDLLTEEGRGRLDTLATTIISLGNQLRVEGHTDNVPINTVRFPSNWELSTARATRVVSYLVEKFGFNPEQLSAAGYGEYRPVAENDTAEGRAKNRRVDLVVMNSRSASAEPR